MVTAQRRRLQRDAAQMSLAVPQVVAHRVGRMLTAGPVPSRRDRREFYRMGAEKVAAFNESWLAMWGQSIAAQQQFMTWWLQAWWRVALAGWTQPPTFGSLSREAQQRMFNSMLDVTHRGMKPVSRRAVANARRLNRAAR